MRKYMRQIARAKMKRAGYKKINKNFKGRGSSFFALNWREFVK